MAPIIASTVAIFKAEKMNGSAVGMRTRRKISTSPQAYERISSTEPAPARQHERNEDRGGAADHEPAERLLERKPARAQERLPVIPERLQDFGQRRQQELLDVGAARVALPQGDAEQED